MRKIIATLGAALLALFAWTAPAQASTGGSGNPHFVYITPSVSGSNLVVNFKEAGVGAGASVTVSTAATYDFVLGCINGGSNHPKASNKTAFSSSQSASQTFTANAGGNVVANLTLTPPANQLSYLTCPSGQTTTLLSASWTDLSITDATNSITVNVPGTWTVS
ncbi:hypothetical protein [Sinomonas terrae]|uniref:Peptidase n=1 Tax=Sinomonas terrae TaxID=2908838 RepID=A0ABS9U5P0_9MICC|nr:hypothetical protein [Sinomonas terrae]MCH6471857.1 hypothetical protein [Sinomonas terrae]